MDKSRKLRIFICHGTEDKPAARLLYAWLTANACDPWLDEESLLGGQVWEDEIDNAIRKSDVVLVCLSRLSASKSGFVQKEIRIALDAADRLPEGAAFLIPIKLEPLDIPSRLTRWHWVELYDGRGHERLRAALNACAIRVDARPPADATRDPAPPQKSAHELAGGFDTIAGLSALKSWFRIHEHAFSQPTSHPSLRPKGVLLLGPPGCGKSSIVRAVGYEWKASVLRFDVGAQYGGSVGETEERLRDSFREVSRLAPAIFWASGLDVLTSVNRETTQALRYLGTLLNWMGEGKGFVIGTAANPERVPKEVLRIGRFDQIFYVDLPTVMERAEILRIHLKYRFQVPEDFDVDRLSLATEGFSGEELEVAIDQALYASFEEPSARMQQTHIEAAIAATTPCSSTMSSEYGKWRAAVNEKQWELASDARDGRS